MLKTYIKKIFEVARRGDAREESYYSALEGLFKGYAESSGKKKIHITTLPKKTEAGNPDFRVWDGKQHIVGYIEAKAPTVEDLDRIEESEQLKRYLHTFPNVILTNFLEFRLYRNGTLVDKVIIGRPFVLHKLKTMPPVERAEDFLKFLEEFFSFSLPRVYNAKNLAIELAKRTRFLRDEVIAQELLEEERKDSGNILGFYKAFKQFLISDLSREDFADLYSQTITYGLFAARTRSENGFNRKLAYDRIPHTIGILREVFHFISWGELPRQMEWIVDDISEVLAVADVNSILHKYFREHKGKDPVVHFYETFLAEYDPATREKRGVYYTPEPVVSFIVRSLHHILKEHFGRADGFASDTVTVLDPAAGTLTFLAEAAKIAVDEFVSKYGEGGKENFIREHILKNFYAFELMMAPYAIGHLKMSFLLEELGYKLQKDDRVKLYLTNTLEMEELAQTELPGMASLSEESHLAGQVKKEQPILVILGNPPYSVSSTNKSDFIEKEMDLYKEDVRTERNIQPLSDDYIKFIRFAHWKIDKAGQGIVGMITNNSYLSGVIHRGIRGKLLESFDEIYILNLHGSSRIGERTPEGSKDENVFDIQQGVSIALYVKTGKALKEKKVYYSDYWGLRKEKYGELLKNNVKTTNWVKLKPVSPYYFFIPKDLALQAEYEKFWKVTEIFTIWSSGVETGRDERLIGLTPQEITKIFIDIFSPQIRTNDLKEFYDIKPTSGWRIEKRRRDLFKREETFSKDRIVPYSYRPYDIRFTYYCDFLRRLHSDVMAHMLKDNMALVTSRLLSKPPFQHALVTQNIIDRCYISVKTKETGYLFPLYLYGRKNNPKKRFPSGVLTLLEPEAEYGSKTPNLSSTFMEKIKKNFRKPPSPEQIFFYIYSVLYSNIYRTKYAEFLKIDFPRIPFTKNYKLFKKMAEYGEKLVELHLLKAKELDKPIAKFQGKGDDKVEKLKYDEKANLLYINKDQYFEGITPELWQYHIGGYQVSEKWLKDRKGRTLSLEDIKHYCKMITALQKTIELQKAIDAIYPSVEEDIIEFTKQ